MSEDKFRLVTQYSFDGLVCAVLLRELELIDDVAFIHPNDMQDGKTVITGRDITASLPYAEGVHLAFDHHLSEAERFEHSRTRWREDRSNLIIDTAAPSSARVIYRHYGGKQRFSDISEDMMQAVDRADTGDYRRADILAPKGWTLLSFLIDPRTGLGRGHNFKTSDFQFMMTMIAECRDHSIDEILKHPDVQERVDLYWLQHYDFVEQLERCSHLEGNVVILDLRYQDPIYVGNRFMIYALFPSATVAIQLVRGQDERNTVLAVRKSILNRRSLAHIGTILLEYGGGGHDVAGTCQIDSDRVMSTLERLVKQINAAG